MGRPDASPILIAGGDRDPNLRVLAATLEARGTEVTFLQVGVEHHPWITWDMASDRLVVDGEEIRPRAAFIRHDVFTYLADGRPASSFRAAAWYTAVMGWVASHGEVRVPNRASLFHATNKPYVLHLAREHGLAIPQTAVTNHVGVEGLPPGPKIVKPINGGGHTQRLAEVLEQTGTRGAGVAASPAIVQAELVQPEVRVYGIGGTFLAFSMVTEDLDYRVRQSARVEPRAEVPEGLEDGLRRLMDRLGLDFAAADFKTDPETGRLAFLEINTGPMFAAFDQVSEGAVTRALAGWLEGL